MSIRRKPIIYVKDLHKSYANREILHGLSFEVHEGECFCLLGPNGAGKTTTLKILTGSLSAHRGKVVIDNVDILSHPTGLKGNLNIIPQHPALDPFLTVKENLWFYGLLQKIDYKSLRIRIGMLTKAFGITHLKNRITFHLSGGEYQRLMVARAFLRDGKMIFMDEPTAGIDILLKNKIWTYFSEMKNKGMTIFLNTHDLNEAEVMSDRIAFMFDGRIIAVDTPNRLKSMIGNIILVIELQRFAFKHGIVDFYTSMNCRVSLNQPQKTIEIETEKISPSILENLHRFIDDDVVINIHIKQPTLNDVFKKLGGVRVGDNLA